MTKRPHVEVVGVMLGLTAMVLTDPLIHTWWVPIAIAASTAGLGGLVIGHAVNSLPRVPARLLAGATAAVTVAGSVVAVVIASSRGGTVQDIAIALSSVVVLRLVGATVDRLTPSINVSLIAALLGSVVGLAAVSLLLLAQPHLSVWAAVGEGSAAGYLEGVVTGFALRPGASTR